MTNTTSSQDSWLWREIMASGSKRRRTEYFSVARALELLEEDDNSDDGMTSGEESDLDRQLQNESCELR